MNILNKIIHIPGFGINSKKKPAQLTKFLDRNILRNLVETNKEFRIIFCNALKNKKLKNDIIKQANRLRMVYSIPILMRHTTYWYNNIPTPALLRNGQYYRDRHTLFSDYDATYKNIKLQRIHGTDSYILNTLFLQQTILQPYFCYFDLQLND